MKSKTISIGTLCMVTFLQAYLLVNVFPYAAYMAVLLWNRDYDYEHSISISHLEEVVGGNTSNIASVSGDNDDDATLVIDDTHENDVDGVPAEVPPPSMQTSGSDDADVKADVKEGSDESEIYMSDTQQRDISNETTEHIANNYTSSYEADDADFTKSAYHDDLSTSDSQSKTEVEESMDKEAAVDVGQIMSSEDIESHPSDDSTADSVEVPEIVQQRVNVPSDAIDSDYDFHQETKVPSEAEDEDYVDGATWQPHIQQQQQQQEQAQQQQEQQQHEQQIQQQQQAQQEQQQQQQKLRRLSMNRTLQAKLPNKITVEDAGPYAALLATSFMIGRTIAAVPWGRLADIYGRKWVLIVSLIGGGLASLWFGMCTSYSGITGAVVARGVMGAMNSIVGVSKTMASELAHYDFDDEEYYDCDDGHTVSEESHRSNSVENGENSGLHVAASISSEEHGNNQTTEMQTPQEQLETRIVGLIMSMRAWGFLVAPGIAGFLADPLCVRTVNHDNTINVDTEQHSSLVHNTLEAYPYLLPNLLGAILCWSTALMVYCGMPETLSECRSANLIGRDFCSWMQNFLVSVLQRCKWSRTSSTAIQQSSECTRGHYGSIENSELIIQEQQQPRQSTTTSFSYILSLRNTRYHLFAYWYYSLVIIAIDEAFPLYCISRNNGLHGLSEKEIGEILSISGLIFSLFQYKIYTLIVDRWGMYKSLGAGTWLGILPILFIPLACMFTGLNHGAIIYLSLLMGVTKIFQSAFFSSITIATNRTVSKELRSSMNGFGGMGAGIAKAIGPLGVGFWMAYSLSWDKATPVGSFIAFVGLASLGLPLLALLPLLKYDSQTTEVI